MLDTVLDTSVLVSPESCWVQWIYSRTNLHSVPLKLWNIVRLFTKGCAMFSFLLRTEILGCCFVPILMSRCSPGHHITHIPAWMHCKMNLCSQKRNSYHHLNSLYLPHFLGQHRSVFDECRSASVLFTILRFHIKSEHKICPLSLSLGHRCSTFAWKQLLWANMCSEWTGTQRNIGLANKASGCQSQKKLKHRVLVPFSNLTTYWY